MIKLICIALVIGYLNAGVTEAVGRSHSLQKGWSFAKDVFQHICPVCALKCGYNVYWGQDNECVSCLKSCGACVGGIVKTGLLPGAVICLATAVMQTKYFRKTCAYECFELAVSCIIEYDDECEYLLDECNECSEKYYKRTLKVAEMMNSLMYAKYTKVAVKMAFNGVSRALDLGNEALKVAALPDHQQLDKLERMLNRNIAAMEMINEAINIIKH